MGANFRMRLKKIPLAYLHAKAHENRPRVTPARSHGLQYGLRRPCIRVGRDSEVLLTCVRGLLTLMLGRRLAPRRSSFFFLQFGWWMSLENIFICRNIQLYMSTKCSRIHTALIKLSGKVFKSRQQRQITAPDIVKVHWTLSSRGKNICNKVSWPDKTH